MMFESLCKCGKTRGWRGHKTYPVIPAPTTENTRNDHLRSTHCKCKSAYTAPTFIPTAQPTGEKTLPHLTALRDWQSLRSQVTDTRLLNHWQQDSELTTQHTATAGARTCALPSAQLVSSKTCAARTTDSELTLAKPPTFTTLKRRSPGHSTRTVIASNSDAPWHWVRHCLPSALH
eukprot:4246590-Amphidinium_carterae.1